MNTLRTIPVLRHERLLTDSERFSYKMDAVFFGFFTTLTIAALATIFFRDPRKMFLDFGLNAKIGVALCSIATFTGIITIGKCMSLYKNTRNIIWLGEQRILLLAPSRISQNTCPTRSPRKDIVKIAP